MNQDLKKTNCPLEKTDATIVVVDTAPVLISDEEAAQVSGGGAPHRIRDSYSRGEHYVERTWL